jgi:hypothetical protein
VLVDDTEAGAPRTVFALSAPAMGATGVDR